MPIYRVEGPDGQIYRVEAPEGATEQQIFSFLQSQLAQQTATAEQQPESGLLAQLKRVPKRRHLDCVQLLEAY